MKAEPVIVILGTADDARALEVKSVTRLQALATTPGAGLTPYVAQLLGAEGEVLATAPVVRLPAHGSGCGCGPSDPAAGPFVFEAMVPDVAPGAGLRIVKRAEEGGPGEAIWTRDAPERPPVVRSFAVTVDRGEGRAAWQARGDGPLEFSLQFSKDRGRSWNGLAVGLTGMEYRFRAETLPSGSLVFRLLAHDGFHSTSRLSRPVVVPRRPPIVSILSPEAGRPFFAAAPLRLWGAVTEDDGAPGRSRRLSVAGGRPPGRPRHRRLDRGARAGRAPLHARRARTRRHRAGRSANCAHSIRERRTRGAWPERTRRRAPPLAGHARGAGAEPAPAAVVEREAGRARRPGPPDEAPSAARRRSACRRPRCALRAWFRRRWCRNRPVDT